MTENTHNPLYPILNADAKAWWYHRKLRDEGKIDEARRRERQSIRRHVKTLRDTIENKGWLTIAHSGQEWTLQTGPRSKVKGYGGLDSYMGKCCMLLEIPVVDMTTVPEERLIEIVNCPIPHLGPSDPERPGGGWGSLDFAPVGYVFERYAEIGATVLWSPRRPLSGAKRIEV